MSRVRFRWIAAAMIVGLVLLTAVSAYRYRWELRGIGARLEATRPLDLRAGVFAPDRKVEIRRSGSLRLVAREYGPPGDSRATVLLLHGHTPQGSNLAFYRVLGRRLAAAGYRVLAPDFAGFGESDDSFSIPYESGFSGDFDVEAWLSLLESEPGDVDTPLFIVAHSAGVSSGMTVGLQDDLVSGIVAIGPSRRVIEDLADPVRADYWWRRNQQTHRKVYGSGFPDWYTKEIWLSVALGEGTTAGLKRPMEYFLPLLQVEGHHPVLLIDGEREPEVDRIYLRAYFGEMAEPKDYHTLAGSDHYSNAAHLGKWAIYDRKVVDETVSVLDEWMTGILESP
jgi:pimeloyl-ACP methyl ester carboxylesterase